MLPPSGLCTVANRLVSACLFSRTVSVSSSVDFTESVYPSPFTSCRSTSEELKLFLVARARIDDQVAGHEAQRADGDGELELPAQSVDVHPGVAGKVDVQLRATPPE